MKGSQLLRPPLPPASPTDAGPSCPEAARSVQAAAHCPARPWWSSCCHRWRRGAEVLSSHQELAGRRGFLCPDPVSPHLIRGPPAPHLPLAG